MQLLGPKLTFDSSNACAGVGISVCRVYPLSSCALSLSIDNTLKRVRPQLILRHAYMFETTWLGSQRL